MVLMEATRVSTKGYSLLANSAPLEDRPLFWRFQHCMSLRALGNNLHILEMSFYLRIQDRKYYRKTVFVSNPFFGDQKQNLVSYF